MKIIIFGYYLHSNAGDDQYIYSFSRIFEEHDLIFVSCDEVSDFSVSDTDIIVIGGGDVFNDYFMKKFNQRFEGKPNKILAVSVGFPDINYLIHTDSLRLIDYLFLRTKQDIELAQKHFHPDRVIYIPDASIALNYIHTYEPVDKKIAICLSRHIYHPQYQRTYSNVLGKLKLFVSHIISKGYKVVFVPFNTSHTNPNENDTVIQHDLMSILSADSLSMVSYISEELNHDELMNVFNGCELIVPFRFHACLFSIYAKKPFFPIYSTRKIKNLLLDCDWNHSHALITNDQDGRVIDINIGMLTTHFDLFVSESRYLHNKLWTINSWFQRDFIKSLFILYRCIQIPYTKDNRTQNSEKSINSLQVIVSDNIQKESQDTIAKLITFYLTRQTSNSPYYYGIKSKLFSNPDYDYKSEWLWVIKDFMSKPGIPNTPYGLFNLGFIDQNDYSGNHRSGWQYVYQNLLDFNNSDETILDMYVDRTFHWESRVYSLAGAIPYTKPWIGFIHHTFDTTFSDYNCETLLQSQDFIQSLKVCRALFVLSDYLKDQLSKRLPGTRVYSLIHPTEFTPVKFSFFRYAGKPDKKIINIGGWLRDIHSFHLLKSPGFKKLALKGKSMNNYFPDTQFLPDLHDFLKSRSSQDQDRCQQHPCCQNICQNISTNPFPTDIQNNWYRHYYKHTSDIISSVEVIEYIENDYYDNLFIDNIIHVNLVDASAVNTVIECIVRNTPILVNKHPAIVELLGDGYPLYLHSDSNDVSGILTLFNVYMAYIHIKSINKSKFTIEYFKQKFIKYVSEVV
jgi:hypothetical protein